jgi:hypothetical protein
MTAKPEFEVSIPNLDAIKDAFRRYPAIAEPIYQRALSATQAVFAQNTHRLNPVPYKTGNLLQSFRYRILRLQASWGPTAKYAPFVEYGTAPHAIMPKTKPFLMYGLTEAFRSTYLDPDQVDVLNNCSAGLFYKKNSKRKVRLRDAALFY